MSSPIYYSVTVDTEEEWDWSSGYPTTRPSVTNVRLLPRFQQLCEACGAAVVYFANYAVLSDPEGKAILRDLATRPNTEIGIHIHPWNTPPLQPGLGASVRNSFLHNLPWDLARAKLDSVLEAFDHAGLKPTSYRGGRYSTSEQIQDYLRDRGVVADCSVLPYTSWPDDGAPDYHTRDLTARRRPPRSPGDTALWELPLTSGWTRRPFAFWRRLFRFLERTPLRRLRLIGVMAKLGIVRKAWLNFEDRNYPEPAAFLPAVAAEAPAAAAFTFHSSSLLPGGSPYATSQADVDWIFRRAEAGLRAVAAYPAFTPATATTTAQLLESAHHARAGH